MLVHYGKIESRIKNPVVVIGNFDGVHLGHRYMFQQVKKYAETINGESAAVTFEPHPRIVLKKKLEQMRLLTTEEEKIKLIEKTGINHLIIIPFTEELAMMSYNEFIDNILIDKIGINTLMIGHDQKIGKNMEGNYEKIKEYSTKRDFKVQILNPITKNDEYISSSLIRKMLLQGKTEKAKEYLGDEYFITGKVIHGEKIGSKIGFPTINIFTENPYKLIPEDGVYAAQVELKNEEKRRNGMLFCGVKSSTGKKVVEINIFDFEKDIYGQKAKIIFYKKIRDTIHFSGTEQLKKKLMEDKTAVEKVFKIPHNN